MAVRFPRIDLESLLKSNKDTTPVIDLKLESYERATKGFLKAVETYKHRSLAGLSERQRKQKEENKRLKDKTREMQNETNQYRLKEIDLMQQIEREKELEKEVDLSVVTAERQISTMESKCQELDAEVSQYQLNINNVQLEREKELGTLQSHLANILPELEVCQQRLFCTIECLENQSHLILVQFLSIDDSEPDREFRFVIDISENTYRIQTCSPMISTLSLLLDELNETRNLYSFIHQMRKEFERLAVT